MNNVAAIYNEIADGYCVQRDKVWREIGWLPEAAMLHLISSRFSDYGIFRFLDVGCGGGHDLQMIKERLAASTDFHAELKAEGIDVSQWMAGKTLSSGFPCEHGSFVDSTRIAEWNFVWCNMVLMHFSLAQVEQAIAKLQSFLSPHGILGIGVKTLIDSDVHVLGKQVINPAHGSVSCDRAMTYFDEFAFQHLLTDSGLKQLARLSLPSSNGEYNYSWYFVSNCSLN